MGLRDIIQAIREYPAANAGLETTQYELRQAQQALEHSEQVCKGLRLQMGEQTHYVKYLSHQSAALQAALQKFCPRLSSVEDMKRFYDTVSPSIDRENFTLYHMAEKVLGMDVSSAFPYEDSHGLFEEMNGRQLLRWLTAAYFHAVTWTIVPGTTYEKAALREVDTSTPEYCAFEKQLYEKVLERMGFQDILAPEQEMAAIEDKTTELKLYTSLFGELTTPEDDQPQTLDGVELKWFENTILRAIEDERIPEEAERGLMAYFDGSNTVNEKVISVFPSVEEVDNRLYGVAVCQIRGELSPNELDELREYCHAQFVDGRGGSFTQCPRHTEYGELYVSFWQDGGAVLLTKDELNRMSGSVSRQIRKGRDESR